MNKLASDKRRFRVHTIMTSDLSPRLRFALEFVFVTAIMHALLGIALREFVPLADRAIVSEAPSVFRDDVNRAVFTYALTGRFDAEQDEGESGRYVRDVRLGPDGDIVAVFKDDAGSAALRGRLAVWALTTREPWAAPVFFWRCQPEGPDGSSVPQASLPNYCKE